MARSADAAREGPLTRVVPLAYAADWSEYFGHHPQDGSGDVHFHLDPLWSDASLDLVGVENYLLLSDWREGFDHADALDGWPAIYDRAYVPCGRNPSRLRPAGSAR
jgi:hypothetical protein